MPTVVCTHTIVIDGKEIWCEECLALLRDMTDQERQEEAADGEETDEKSEARG